MPERADGRLDLCEDLRGPVLGPPLGRLTRGPPPSPPPKKDTFSPIL